MPSVNDVPVGTISIRKIRKKRQEDTRMDFKLTNMSGRGEPGGRVLVHIPGRHMQWVGVDGARKLEYSDRKGISKRSSS